MCVQYKVIDQPTMRPETFALTEIHIKNNLWIIKCKLMQIEIFLKKRKIYQR